jgi:hypothetical protein
MSIRLLRLMPAAALLLFAVHGAALAQYKCTGNWMQNQMKRCCSKEWGCLCYPSGQFSSTPCDRPAPVLSSHDKAAENLRNEIGRFQGNSRMTDYLIKDLNGAMRKANGEKPSAELGRFVSRLAGVGACNRHFYNNSQEWWGIGLWYAGTCEGEMVPNSAMGKNHFACLIPPHSSTIIHYANYGDEPDGGKIAISGPYYTHQFNLREVGCYIKHNGNTGVVTLNDPADGDIATR